MVRCFGRRRTPCSLSYTSVIFAEQAPQSQKCSVWCEFRGGSPFCPVGCCPGNCSMRKILPSRRYSNGFEQAGLAHLDNMNNLRCRAYLHNSVAPMGWHRISAFSGKRQGSGGRTTRKKCRCFTCEMRCRIRAKVLQTAKYVVPNVCESVICGALFSALRTLTVPRELAKEDGQGHDPERCPKKEVLRLCRRLAAACVVHL